MPCFRTLIFLSLCLVLLSCGGDSRTKVAAEEERLFVETYVSLARAIQDHEDDPDSLAAAQKAIFQQAGLDREEYAALAQKLEASPEAWMDIWEQIVKRLEEEQKKEGG